MSKKLVLLKRKKNREKTLLNSTCRTSSLLVFGRFCQNHLTELPSQFDRKWEII